MHAAGSKVGPSAAIRTCDKARVIDFKFDNIAQTSYAHACENAYPYLVRFISFFLDSSISDEIITLVLPSFDLQEKIIKKGHSDLIAEIRRLNEFVAIDFIID